MQSQRFYSKEAPRVHAKGPFGHSGRHHRPLIGRNEPRVFHEIVVIKYSRIGAGGLWRRLPRRSGLVSQTDLREMDIPSALTARPLGRWRSPCRTISTETAGATSSGATTTARSRSGHEWTAITSGNNIASSPDATWHVKGVGDYNGGGKRRHSLAHDNGALAEWLMKGSNILSGPNITTSPEAIWHTQGHHFDLV
jgi:hypothetical protein